MKEISCMFCKKCGKELREDRIFCTGCGMQTNIPKRLEENLNETETEPIESRGAGQSSQGFVADEKTDYAESHIAETADATPADEGIDVAAVNVESGEETYTETIVDKSATEKKPGVIGRVGKKIKTIFGAFRKKPPAEKHEEEHEINMKPDAGERGTTDDNCSTEKYYFDSGVSVADIEKADDVESVSVGNASGNYIYDNEDVIHSGEAGTGLSAVKNEVRGRGDAAPEEVYEYQKEVNLLNVYLRQARETWFRSAVTLLHRISTESGNGVAVVNSKLSGDGEMAIKACQFVLSGMWLDEKKYIEKKMISRFMMGYFDSMNHSLNDVMQFNDMLKSYTGKKNFMTSVANQISRHIAGKDSALLESMILVQIIPELVAYTNIAVSEAFDDMQGAGEQIEILKRYERKLYSEFRNFDRGNTV